MSETLSVSQVCERVENVVKSGFPEEIWIEGVLSSLKRSQNGHVYFDLVDSSENLGTQAKSVLGVTLFAKTKANVNRMLTKAGGTRMEDGVKVRIRGEISYYAPQGRIQLIMSMIDPDYTIGQLAADKEKLIAELKAKNLLEKNSLLPFPLLPLKIALITSLKSAAHHDFINELLASRFNFIVDEIDCRVQGLDSVPMLENAIRNAETLNPDVIVIVRGGGSRGDLVAFDHRNVALAIANCSIPVITGVGHDTDHSVADDVAHTPTKTPTAAAALLLRFASKQAENILMQTQKLRELCQRRVEKARSQLLNLTSGVTRESIGFVSRSQLTLDNYDRSLAISVDRQVSINQEKLKQANKTLSSLPMQLLGQHKNDLETTTTRLLALDPAVTMQRGWSITRTSAGELVRDPNDVTQNTELITTTQKGNIYSVAIESKEVSDD